MISLFWSCCPVVVKVHSPMLATTATAVEHSGASISERKLTEHERKLLRLAFDALARQASSSCISFPCAKLEHPEPGSVEIDAIII